MTGHKLWGGRFTKRTDPVVERFSASIGADYRLARYDVIGSIAHARMLGRCRIVSAAESRRLVQGLTRLLKMIERGAWTPDPSAEDVHTQLQGQLGRLIGPVARKLHTARSRNDQVSLDLRLYCRDQVEALAGRIRECQRALIALGTASGQTLILAYTHLQPAQPVLVAHHLLAYVEMLARDAERLQEARRRINVLPLGACAVAGTSLPIDRRYVARLLGFDRVAANSMDAVADRDFAVELVAVLASLHVHLSRLSEDLVLWATQEFGLLAMDDAVATGSSAMPQKKNPDVPELVRGQAGIVIGHLTALLTVLKGLPLAYNRDLQWDKPLVFGAVEATHAALEALTCFLRHVRIRPKRAAALSAADGLYATELAEWLVERGVAFADAHQAVGRLVAYAETSGRRVAGLSLGELKRFSPAFTPAALRLTSARAVVARKRSEGSSRPQFVAQALARWRKQLRG